ncbi:MAG: response regulator transcription factor [Gemmatimonadota bacterium]
MTEPYLLAYVFATFLVGIACVGAALVLARLRHDELARAFLLFYVPLSVLVLAALLLTFEEVAPSRSATVVFVLEYGEAFVGRYGVMLGLPLFAHRVFGARGRVRNAAVAAVVLTAFAAQHITEFVLGGAWDPRGDVAEDVLFAGVVGYTVWVGVRRLNEPAVYGPLARRFLGVLLLGVPALGHDIVVVDGPGLRLYPLWYCAVGAVVIATLVGRRPAAAGTIPVAWGLTPREEEVVGLVRRGLSNREIGRELAISPNTVKTHLRSVFDKSGFRTRVALIAALAAPPGAGGAPPTAGVGASASGERRPTVRRERRPNHVHER